MQAAVAPAVKSSWQVKDVPQPQPGLNQVLVKMHASGICYTDVHQTLGNFPGTFPRILGHEPVGEIVAVARDVVTRKVGDRVGTAWIQSTCGRCEWCRRGRRMFCPYLQGTGVQAQGGHAEFMLMNADATYLLPNGVSYEQAAPIFCAGYTVYSGLRWARPQPHERIAVVGIGGLGHLAVQYAKATGFETIAVSHSPDKDRMIRDLGADEVVRDGKGLAAAGGADVILSTTNSAASMVDSIQGLRPDGRLVTMGADTEPISVSLGDLISKRIQIIGSQQNGPEYLYEALDFVAKGKVANPVMIAAYRAGIPGNGKAFPDGSKIAKIEWHLKKSTEAPFDVNIPAAQQDVFFIEKDTKRFPATKGWAYAQFNYNAASDKFTPEENGASCGFACHSAVAAKDYIFTAYGHR